MKNTVSHNQTPYTIIGILSVAIPLVVAFLLFGGKTTRIEGLDVAFLPHLNAVLNTGTFLCLLAGGFAIRNKNIALHRAFMLSAFVLSSIFLISYVIYHNNAESTTFPKDNPWRILYLILLLTHILFSMVVVPLVLLSIYFAWTKQIERHKKIVKWAYPVWLYVASTGVIVYLMISPYYIH